MGMASEKQQLIDVLKLYHDNRFTPQVYEHSIFGKAALLLERSEEVVQCKDCKDHNRCEVEDLLVYFDPTVGHYCCHGERKDNDI